MTPGQYAVIGIALLFAAAWWWRDRQDRRAAARRSVEMQSKVRGEGP